MSLIIQKFAEGGSPEVRIYKRGNDDIELDNFIQQAEVGFNNWLNSIDVKEKYKNDIRSAYRDMITRINENPESFTARLGGGFTNTAGITNKKKGFDAYGVAAGYLGNVLRGMQVYIRPEITANKPKYKRSGTVVTPDIQKLIVGNNPESFIRLDDDSYNETTGQRNITNRVNQTVTGLSTLKGRLHDIYDFDSDDDYQHAVNRIDRIISLLQDDNLNNDWFSLEQLGFTNVNDFFTTGDISRPITPLSPEEAETNAAMRRTQRFEEYINQHYPYQNRQPMDPISIAPTNDERRMGNSTNTTFQNWLNGLNNQELTSRLHNYLSSRDRFDPRGDTSLLRAFNNMVPADLTRNQYIRSILEMMKSKGILQPFTDNPNKYYIPDLDDEGLGYVWDSSSNQIQQMSVHDIPYRRDQIFTEFTNIDSPTNTLNTYLSQRYPVIYNKKGGILKAQNGYSVQSGYQLWGNTNYGNYDVNQVLPGWDNSDHSGRTQSIGINPDPPTIIRAYNLQRKYISSGKMAEDVRSVFQTWKTSNSNKSYQDFITDYNNKVNNVRRLSLTKFSKGYGNDDFQELYDDYNWLYPSSADELNPSKGLLGSDDNLSSILGSTMFNRNALTFSSDNDAADLRLIPFVDNNPDIQFRLKNDGTLELIESSPTSEQQIPDIESSPQQNPIADGNIHPERSEIDEVIARLKNLSSKTNLVKQGIFEELGAGLLGAGRLAGSIRANNRIARVVKGSLRPKLLNTYDLYSPITGAFGELQLRNRQGAEILAQSYRPFTSDASLASARMLEGQRLANNLQYQGFLADDREIRRTQAEALQRQENNTQRRTEIANKNREAIITNNQNIAQLEAARIKQNWNSIDNYLRGVEGRVIQSLTENRNRRNQFDLQVSNDEAEAWGRQAMQQLYNQFESWKNSDPTRTNKTYSEWINENYSEYSRAMQDINSIIRAMKYKGYANAYGLRYNWPTYIDKTGSNKPIDFDVNNYSWLQHGGSLKLNSSKLIEKIIKKNESNS